MRIIDQLVVQWHNDVDCKTKIHEYIGLTLSEYDDFMNAGRVPDRLPELSAEYKVRSTRMTGFDRSGPVTASGPDSPGWVTPAKREV